MSVTPRRPSRRAGRDLISDPVIVGTMILAVTVIGVFLSYNANRGLPFVPTYNISADVPDAAELVAGSEVRIGGRRVGQVTEIAAMPPRGDAPSFARLKLALEQDLDDLPVDTTAQVRPRSILGAKYVDLVPGTARRILQPGARLPVSQALPANELDEAFNVFDDETKEGLQTAVNNLGDALAGRGPGLHELITEFGDLMPPLQRVLANLLDTRTDLRGFVRGAASAFTALEPVSARFGGLFDNGATTLAAIDRAGENFDRTLVEFPRLARDGTPALGVIAPVLRDAAAIARDVKGGTTALPRASRELAAALRAGTPVLRRSPRLARDLGATLTALDQLALDPAAAGAVRGLIATVRSLGSTLTHVNPVQTQCNMISIFLRNFVSVVGEGNEEGAWVDFIPIVGFGQGAQNDTQSADFNANPAPVESAEECEGGNEPFSATGRVGNVPGNQPNTTEATRPPGSATARARRAGLLTPVPGVAR